MNPFTRVMVAITLFGASPALAQEATPEQVAAARETTDQVIQAAGASAYFENISDGAFALARHRASGMICVFFPGDTRNQIRIFPTRPAVMVAGDDVACTNGSGNTTVTMYASRYASQPGDEDLLANAIGEVNQLWQNIEPLEGSYPMSRVEGQDLPSAHAFIGDLQGRRMRSLIVVQNIGEWSFKARASGAPDDENVTRMGSLVYSVSIPGGWESYRLGQ